MLPELTSAENLPVIWGCMPLSWTIGSTVGPVVGGYLSRPAERYPRVFGDFKFLKTYPYFLPCAIPSVFSAVAWVAVFYLLKETVKSPVPIRHFFTAEYQQGEISRTTPLRHVLNSRVIMSVGNYAFIALIEMAYRAIQPLFLATPIDFGGLGLPPPTIGNILSAGGALTGVSQILFFPTIHRRLGDKATFVKGLASTLPLFLLFPIAHLLVVTYSFNWLLWMVIALQSITSFGYGLSYGKHRDLIIWLDLKLNFASFLRRDTRLESNDNKPNEGYRPDVR
ncbi:hypothetical protein C0992_006813 [Termitomyces sp. T32_za158]|nr:hypothetical protein C0992_006813 [Termitomyces sp. T32_za158]